MGDVTTDWARVHRPRAIEVPPGGSRCQEHNARQGGSKSGDAQRVTERSNRTTLFHRQWQHYSFNRGVRAPFVLKGHVSELLELDAKDVSRDAAIVGTRLKPAIRLLTKNPQLHAADFAPRAILV